MLLVNKFLHVSFTVPRVVLVYSMLDSSSGMILARSRSTSLRSKPFLLITRIVSSPDIVPAMLAKWYESIPTASGIANPGMVCSKSSSPPTSYRRKLELPDRDV